MAESPSSSTIAEAAENVASTVGAKPSAGLPVERDASGIPVVDLREAPAKDGLFVMVDGELAIRLADGTEWAVSGADAVVFQLADQAFVAASAVVDALDAFAATLPVTSLTEAAGRQAGAFPATAADAAVAPQAVSTVDAGPDDDGTIDTGEGEEQPVEPVSGGAQFRALEIVELGETLELSMQLAPTARENGRTSFSDELRPDDAGTPGNGSRFVNLAPVAANDVATTSEQQAVQIDVLANDHDANPNDTLKMLGVDATGIAGTVTVHPDGSLSYDPSGQFRYLGKGESATEHFSYTIVDPQGATSKAKVSVTVTGVNDTPIGADDHVVTNEKAHVAIDALANDSDPDINDSLRVVGLDTSGLKGTATLQPNGSIVYNPNGQFTHLGKGEHATETFTYTLADQHGATTTAEVTVRIDGVNDAPVAHDDLVWVSQEGQARFNALANDFDPDLNDVLRVESLHSLGGSKGQRWINHDGTVSYRPYGAYDYLGKGEIAYQKFGYTVTDQHGATDTATVTVAVVGLNDTPVAQDDFVRVSEDGEVRFDALANDYDPDLTDSIRAVELFSLGGSQGQRWINHDGTISYRPYGAYNHLGEGEVAYQKFGYTIADQHGASNSAVICIEIIGENDRPSASDDRAVTTEASMVAIDVLANDDDPDQHDSIRPLSVDTTGLKGSVSVNPDGTLTYDPNGQFDHLKSGETATETFKYTIVDQQGALSSAEVEVQIAGLNGDAHARKPMPQMALFDILQDEGNEINLGEFESGDQGAGSEQYKPFDDANVMSDPEMSGRGMGGDQTLDCLVSVDQSIAA